MNSRAITPDAALNGVDESELEIVEPVTTDTLSVGDTINLGARSRMVALPLGLAVEVKDSEGNWVRQLAWEEE